jgi:hypothetical protein
LLKLSPTILSVAFIMYLSYRASSGLSMGGGGGGAGAGVCEKGLVGVMCVDTLKMPWSKGPVDG